MTIDDALEFLQKAKKEVGGDACLILSLTCSELDDTDVDGLKLINDGESRYVQVNVYHPQLLKLERAK